MRNYSDREIVDLLRSDNSRERNQACRILEYKFKGKVIAWTRRQKGNLDGEDIFQSTVLEFILAVQSYRYEPKDGVNMYSYFYLIMRSVWIKQSPFHLNKSGEIEWYNLIPASERQQNPEEIVDYELKREAFLGAIESLDLIERGIVKAVFMQDRRLIDIVDEYNLKNYNNARQKFLSIRKKLTAIFKNTQLFGIKND